MNGHVGGHGKVKRLLTARRLSFLVCAFLVLVLGYILFEEPLLFRKAIYRYKTVNEQEQSYNVTFNSSNTPLVTVGIYIYLHLQPDGQSMGSLFQDMWNCLNISLPSFCKTISKDYSYLINLISYRNDITIDKRSFDDELRHNSEQSIQLNCPKDVIKNIKVVVIPSSQPPDRSAWALGEVIWDQYVGGVEFFYVKRPELPFHSEEVQRLERVLLKNYPPKFGVLFSNQSSEYFFHATHLQIFGWAYPRDIYDEKTAIYWLLLVYQKKSTSSSDRVLDRLGPAVGQQLTKRFEQDISTLKRYKNVLSNRAEKEIQPERRIISMSLYGSDKRYTNNAVRNAALVKVNFPSWTLRFYVEKSDSNGNTKYARPPHHVLMKLLKLGAELNYIDMSKFNLAPMLWRFLVADDPDVDVFIVRDCDSLLTARDATVVEQWLKSNKTFHCIRDHPSHGNFALSGGLWGAKRIKFIQYLETTFTSLMGGRYSADYLQDMTFLGNDVWPRIVDHAYCHDSVSCDRWPSSHPFPVARIGQEHIGAVYDEFGECRQGDLDIIKNTPINEKCVLKSRVIV